MGIYRDKVLPRLVDKACGMKTAEPLRRGSAPACMARCSRSASAVDCNTPHYPAAVTAVAAVEPSDLAWKLAGDRRAASTVPITRSGLDGETLPLPDDSCDTALSTWTLCTIPDVTAALDEIRRVLKPGGTLHFVEHGLAPDHNVQRWQHRLEPLQKRLVGGCHLTRPITHHLADAGSAIRDLDVFYEDGALKFLAADSLGVAECPTSTDR
jgi:SAM-dependent methyltransferase